jgi:hypothetical protein
LNAPHNLPEFAAAHESGFGLPPGIAKRSIGQLRLRGKENEIELYALTAAASATSAGGEIPALSSRLG